MGKVILTWVVLFFCFQASAQERTFYGPLEISDSSQHYVFAAEAYIRAAPSTSAVILDTLKLGCEVLLETAVDKEYELKGVKAPWVKISYKDGNHVRQGYIWSGLLSFLPLRRGNIKFIYGIDRMVSRDTVYYKEKITSKNYLVGLKVLRNDTLVAADEWYMPEGESASLPNPEILPGRKLRGVQYMTAISFGGEACGVAMNTYSHIWTGNQLHRLPDLMNVGDAGIYYHTEDLVFPADKGGRPNTIILRTVESEATGKTGHDGQPAFKTTHSKKLFTWDGKIIRPQ